MLTTTESVGVLMFEESKKLYDRAVAQDAALAQIENQKSGSTRSHKVRNTFIVFAAAVILVLLIVLR